MIISHNKSNNKKIYVFQFYFQVVLVEWREDKLAKQKKAFSFLLQRYKVNLYYILKNKLLSRTVKD